MPQFAVIKSGGKQYKVAEGETIKLEKLDAPEGGEVVFGDVLLVSNEIELKLG